MTDEIINQFLDALRTDIINSMQANGKYATGQTAKQITIINNNNTAQLVLPPFMQALETGRSPTSQNAIPGDPPMIERIRQWCQAKGIPDNAAWAVKKSIDKKGYKGVPGVLTEPLSENNINNALQPFMEQLSAWYANQILQDLKLSITA